MKNVNTGVGLNQRELLEVVRSVDFAREARQAWYRNRAEFESLAMDSEDLSQAMILHVAEKGRPGQQAGFYAVIARNLATDLVRAARTQKRRGQIEIADVDGAEAAKIGVYDSIQNDLGETKRWK